MTSGAGRLAAAPARERIAAIVGGSGSLGMATAHALLRKGVGHIVLMSRDEVRGQHAVEAVGPNASFLRIDGADALSAMRAIKRIEEIHGRLDVLVVATAAPALPCIFADIPASEVAQTFFAQALPPMIACAAALPLMRRTWGGSVVLVASDAAKVATPGEAVLGAAMAAIVTFARTLAMEVKRDGIRVNAVTPSLIDGTDLHDRLMSDPFSARLFGKARELAKLGVPSADDVAALIAFLSGDDASRITGQAVSVNGGISAA